MPKLVFGFDEQIGAWVAERVPHLRTVDSFGAFTTIGIASEHGNRLLAGAVYHNFIPDYGHAEVTFAADSARWGAKGIIRAILSVPFLQWQCRRITAVTPHTNDRSVKL